LDGGRDTNVICAHFIKRSERAYSLTNQKRREKERIRIKYDKYHSPYEGGGGTIMHQASAPTVSPNDTASATVLTRGQKKNHDAGSECVYSLTKKQNGGANIVVHAYFIRYSAFHSPYEGK